MLQDTSPVPWLCLCLIVKWVNWLHATKAQRELRLMRLSLQILIGHTRVDALCRLVDVGVNLQDHVVVSDRITAYHGIRQLLHEDILTYLAIQQMLHNNWSLQYIAGCQGACDECDTFRDQILLGMAGNMGLWHFRQCPHNENATEILRCTICDVLFKLDGLGSSFFMDGNQLSTGWGQVKLKMDQDRATGEAYRLFCDTVLLPEIVAACAALRYSALRFGGKPGVDYAVPAWDDAEAHLDMDLADRVWVRELENDVCDVLSFGFNMNISHKHDWDAIYHGTSVVGNCAYSEWWMPTR
jgi:hypothetical protein